MTHGAGPDGLPRPEQARALPAANLVRADADTSRACTSRVIADLDSGPHERKLTRPTIDFWADDFHMTPLVAVACRK